jgi:hypothetical protein
MRCTGIPVPYGEGIVAKIPKVSNMQGRYCLNYIVIIIIIIIIICLMELGHLLTRSGLTYLEVSSEVCHDSSASRGIVFHYPG